MDHPAAIWLAARERGRQVASAELDRAQR